MLTIIYNLASSNDAKPLLVNMLKTEYEMRIGDWSSFVCSSVLRAIATHEADSVVAAGLSSSAVEIGCGPLAELSDASAVELVVSASAGKLVGAKNRRNPTTDTWLARFEDRKSTRLNSSH